MRNCIHYKFTLNSRFCHNVLNILFLLNLSSGSVRKQTELFTECPINFFSTDFIEEVIPITGCKNPKEFLLQCKTISDRIFLDSSSFGDHPKDWLLRNLASFVSLKFPSSMVRTSPIKESENVMFSRTFLCN